MLFSNPTVYFQVKPQILKSNGASAAVQQSILSGPADSNLAPISTGAVPKEEDSKYAALSSYLGSPDHSSDPGSPPPMLSLKTASTPAANDYPFLTLRTKSTDECSSSPSKVNTSYGEDGVAPFMESILQYMKNRRLSHRTYKIPFMKEKKKRVMDFKPLEELRYLFCFQNAKMDCFCEQFLNNFAAVCFSNKIPTLKIPMVFFEIPCQNFVREVDCSGIH